MTLLQQLKKLAAIAAILTAIGGSIAMAYAGIDWLVGKAADDKIVKVEKRIERMDGKLDVVISILKNEQKAVAVKDDRLSQNP